MMEKWWQKMEIIMEKNDGKTWWKNMMEKWWKKIMEKIMEKMMEKWWKKWWELIFRETKFVGRWKNGVIFAHLIDTRWSWLMSLRMQRPEKWASVTALFTGIWKRRWRRRKRTPCIAALSRLLWRDWVLRYVEEFFITMLFFWLFQSLERLRFIVCLALRN